MTQQINLLNTALIRPRDWLSLKNIGLIYAVALVLMYSLYTRSNAELQALAQQRETALVALESTRNELAVIANQSGASPDTQEQEQLLKKLTLKKEAQAKLLATFQHLQGESGHHILDYMIGFASQTMNGVWITGFKLNGFEQQISVTGNALSAEQVPAFIEHLGKHVVFAGKLFSGLTLKETALKETSAIQSVSVADPNKAVVNTVQSPVSADSDVRDNKDVFKIIEFSVKGQGVSGSPDDGDHPAENVSGALPAGGV